MHRYDLYTGLEAHVLGSDKKNAGKWGKIIKVVSPSIMIDTGKEIVWTLDQHIVLWIGNRWEPIEGVTRD